MKKLALCFLFLTACPKPVPTVAPPAPTLDAGTPSRLTIVNKCEVDIWVQQQNLPGAALVHLEKGAKQEYAIPAEGLASTRLWPKLGCDKAGNNCIVGQSSPPCPAAGCSPPVDSKLEATWGCTLADKNKCGFTPQKVRMLDTFWNASAVDGYTLPFTVTVKGGDGRKSCVPVDCLGLSGEKCPTDDNLGPGYTKQDLHVKGAGGCFSTCTKLNYPGFGGDGLNNPSGPVEKMYCCPTPPVSAVQCQAGPVVGTKYVKEIHRACKNTAYGYAYDDGLGGRTCSGDTAIEVVIGPGCASPLK